MKSFVYVFNVKLFWWCLQFLENEGNENFLDLGPKYRRVQTSYIWKKKYQIVKFVSTGKHRYFELLGTSIRLRNIRGFETSEVAFQSLFLEPLTFTCLLVEAYVEYFYYSDRGVQFRWNIFCLCCFSMWNTYKYLWRQLIMKSNLCSDYHIAFSFLSTFLHILIACSIFHVFLEYIPYPVFLGIEN